MPFITTDNAEITLSDSDDNEVVAKGFGLPLRARMDIVTEGGAPVLNKEDYVNCTYTITDPDTETTLFTDTGRIRGRGNSTWTMPKKPYKVKLDDKKPIMGMPKSKDWALLANYIDPSRLRGSIVFWMSQFTGLPWAPRSRNMDVYFNGDYLGFYQLTESVEVDDSRVDVKSIEDEDITEPNLTGGYIMEVDTRLEENAEIGWRTRLGIPIIFDTPDGDIQEQYDYMHAFTQVAEDSLYSEDFLEGGWKQYFDVDSWCDWYLLTELSANNDSGFGSSVKITKQRNDDHLYLGPAWDYDASFGITFFIPHPTYGWWTRVGATWITRMLEDPSFVSRLKERWISFKTNLLSAKVTDYISQQEDSIASALADDLAKWGTSDAPDVASFLTSRLSWIDNELAQATGKTDNTPPSAPTGLTLDDKSTDTVTLSWDDAGASNGTGVVGYRVRAEQGILAETAYPYNDPINTVIVKELTTATTYTFTLECRDASGNWSELSDSLEVTTD